MSDPNQEFVRVFTTPDVRELRESFEQARSFVNQVEKLLKPGPHGQP